MTVVLEWGWNNYPRDVLVDLKDVGSSKVGSSWKNEFGGEDSSHGLVALYSDPEYGANLIKEGRGNYYAMVGMITMFSYAIRDDGGYDCTLSVVNIGSTAMDQKTKNVQFRVEKKQQKKIKKK